MLPHRQQPTRLPRPWDSPGKNIGVGCHFLLQCMKVKNESEVTQSCPTLSAPWTAAYQAPPFMGFSRQEYWSGVPLPSPMDSVFSCAKFLNFHLKNCKSVCVFFCYPCLGCHTQEIIVRCSVPKILPYVSSKSFIV